MPRFGRGAGRGGVERGAWASSSTAPGGRLDHPGGVEDGAGRERGGNDAGLDGGGLWSARDALQGGRRAPVTLRPGWRVRAGCGGTSRVMRAWSIGG